MVDDVPIWVETRLSLEVSGKAREIELTGALLPGTTVVAGPAISPRASTSRAACASRCAPARSR